MYLSDLVDKLLVTTTEEVVGRLHDVVAHVGDAPLPSVTGLLIRQKRDELFLCMRDVDHLGRNGALTAQPALTVFRRRVGDVLLAREVRDTRVLDRRGPRLVRVNDVLLEETLDGWRVSAVAFGTRALLRRILPRPGYRHVDTTRLLPWGDLELLTSEMSRGRHS